MASASRRCAVMGARSVTMNATQRFRVISLTRLLTTSSKTFSQRCSVDLKNNFKTIATFAVTSVTAYIAYEAVNSRFTALRPTETVLAKESGESAVDRTQLHREVRFLNFASIEFDGNVYMTPLDFLESITEENPRSRTRRRHLRQSELEKYLKNTPSKRKGSPQFFRGLVDQGMISYTEYLFLLCVLTKPRSGFRIAFNMFDLDGDQRVDKKEFLVLEQLMANSSSSRRGGGGGAGHELVDVFPSTSHGTAHLDHHSNIWSLLKESIDAHGRNGELPLNDTTLIVHFFGRKGNDVLNYEDFHRFMDNLQTEVLELEFLEFSHGMPTIKEEEFARILLRYTILSKEEHEKYLERLRKRITHEQGITFADFKEFCQFLNNLDDFALALRIYTYADHPISEVDFKRAVKACTGQTLNSHLVHVVFQLFDEDGDGKLSHKEFVSVMKERLHRGAKILGQNQWENFKNCVKNEVKTS